MRCVEVKTFLLQLNQQLEPGFQTGPNGDGPCFVASSQGSQQAKLQEPEGRMEQLELGENLRLLFALELVKMQASSFILPKTSNPGLKAFG